MIILLILVIIIFLLQFFMRLSIKLEIENLRFMLPKTDNKLKNNESKILLKVYLFNKIKIAQIDLKKSNLKNNKLNNKLIEKMIPHRFNLKYNEDIIIFLKNDTYILEKLDLKIEVGVEDAAITAITVGILYTIIGNFLRNKIKDTKYQKYEITPIYKGKNIIKIKFDGIFTVKMANIIYMIKFFVKRRVDKNGRTSYRRSYAYSNE